MSRSTSFRRAAWLATFALTCAVVAHADALPTSQRPVGEVTMSVGPVIRTPAQGLPETVHRGSPILAGDRLDTAEGGHVHIRFIDGALVSVRPGSRMWVQDYRYDPQNVSMSLVRFKLEYGVARAISGAAAEGAKDRFRLNTPLVAIGVRGTDFVVRTGDFATRAAVNQGAIIMAPLGGECQAQALGPCGTPSAKLLAADMGQLLVEFRAQLAQPEIKPLQGSVFAGNASDNALFHPSPVLAHNVVPVVAPSPLGRSESEALVTTALSEDTVKAAISQSGQKNTPEVPVTPPPVVTPPVVIPDPVTPPTPQPPVTPPVVVIPEPPPVVVPPPVLQWGRWAAVATGDADIAVSRAQAADGRNVTVGNSQYVLYRAENGATDLAPGLGSYQFNLDKGYAQYSLGGQVSAATVQQGHLTLDFANRQFATDLRVSSALTGVVGLAGAGFIRSDGVFFDRSVDGQAIAGAAALDGKSAGYFFEKSVGAGSLSGITLWSRP
jgi:hypothetical protein